jgi:hypothetical protein
MKQMQVSLRQAQSRTTALATRARRAREQVKLVLGEGSVG